MGPHRGGPIDPSSAEVAALADRDQHDQRVGLRVAVHALGEDPLVLDLLGADLRLHRIGHAGRALRPTLTLLAGGAVGPAGALLALRPTVPLLAGGAVGPASALLALRPTVALLARRSVGPVGALLALRATVAILAVQRLHPLAER